MNYRQSLEYMYAQLPMYHRIGTAAYKKDLTNTLELCRHLGDPQRAFPSIHIAGTNGKGSVSHILSAILQAAGYKTGLYISPHYKDFRERIKINGQMIPKRRVSAFISRHEAVMQTIRPSFFEMTVALAFDYFAEEKVDIAVIETGLGGRLDSTNVITPLVSVITNIGLDHMAMLGDTLAAIAGEKAGIIKPGVPVVIGEETAETMPVFEAVAQKNGSRLYAAQRRFSVELLEQSDLATAVYAVRKQGESGSETVELDAGGPYQKQNLGTVLQTVECLQSVMPIQWEHVVYGLKNLRAFTGFMGRWQVLGLNPIVLVDSAHNEPGIVAAFAKINQMKFENLHIVCGFVNDKSLDHILPLFPTKARYYFAKANIPRGLDAEELRGMARSAGLQGLAYGSVKKAFRAARSAAMPTDMVLVVGSIFVVAEVI